MPQRPPIHRPPRLPQANQDRRLSSTRRGYTWQWHLFRNAYLRANPLCVRCLTRDLLEPATDVDHIRPVTGPDDPAFFDPSAVQSLCSRCHKEKTAREDGAFGRPRQGIPGPVSPTHPA
jgi:5-methylcytosine-specific restriction protein A